MFYFCKYSQTCVQRPPSRPENWSLFSCDLKKTCFWVGFRWSLFRGGLNTGLTVFKKTIKPKITFWSRKSPKYYEVRTKIKKCRSIIPVIVIGIFVVWVRFIRKFVEKIASAHSWHFAGSVWKKFVLKIIRLSLFTVCLWL